MNRRFAKRVRLGALFLQLVFALVLLGASDPAPVSTPVHTGPVVTMTINGPITPATDDYLRTTLERAAAKNARLVVISLNTPGGLLNSMQTMVERMLTSSVPIAVFVTPSGGSATSAGVFITLAAHVAVMSPGTTIGAAHPVTGTGQDVSGDMRAKVENFAVSLITAISEVRGRNVKWAEQAVRESVSVTDREAVELKIVDFTASDLNKLLAEAEGRTVTVNGVPVTLRGLADAPRESAEMTFRQKLVNILADPNIAILLGLGAMLGIGLELYHPGGFLPGVVGVICLVLSLTSAQVLPINYGGLALLILGAVFFVAELLAPSFGLWGVAGMICLVLGSIYFVDTDMVWSADGFSVNRMLVGSLAAVTGAILLGVGYLVVRTAARQPATGREGIINQSGVVKTPFEPTGPGGSWIGRVQVKGELWHAEADGNRRDLRPGDHVVVTGTGEGLVLTVRALDEQFSQ